jgi:[NiFe] hydrogenase assembly HybE family chaperone
MSAAEAVGRRLELLYKGIAEGPMAGLPICNPRLTVAALGFRELGGEAVGIVATPWFLNVVAAPLGKAVPARAGETRRLTLPAGALDMIVGELPGFGRLDAASLFSPMHGFADMEAALGAAEDALGALFAPPPPHALDRRAFLRGRRAAGA